ncbi:MAG: hypothetical protein M1829_006687 [Trizodia sp. TS-e1964]|nr:MAG: hypothetical protein M1829_006687 [Trizodia sp. TS-e1964]
MSTAPPIPQISPAELHARLTAATAVSATTTPPPSTTPTISIIDVRDADHIGGHIRASTWLPSAALTPASLAALAARLEGVDTVVFHCALSQVRGPRAARAYAYARRNVVQEEGGKGQEVLVLRGGFVEWQRRYGADADLTAGWVRGVWAEE